MFATSTKTATFLLTLTPWDLVVRPAGAITQLGGTFIWCDARRHPPRRRFAGCAGRSGRSPSVPSARAAAASSGRSASTTVQPLLLADRSSSSRSASVIRSASCSGSTTRRSIVPTYPPARTDGRSARIRATDHHALRLRNDDACLRQVDQLAHEIGRPERALATAQPNRGVAQRDDTIDVRDTGYSDQVFHADGSNLAGFGDQALDRVRPRSIPGPAIRSSAASDGSLATRSRVRPTGIAFRSPSANIRHRFGGHLRAARMLDPDTPLLIACTDDRRAVAWGGSCGIGEKGRERVGRVRRTGSSQGVSTGDLEETE